MCLVGAAKPTNGGTEGSIGPSTLAATEPMLGRPPTEGSERFGQPLMHWYASCPPVAPTTERITAHRSMIDAILANTSQIWMPATRVAIGLNSPRISAGASVLISHIS